MDIPNIKVQFQRFSELAYNDGFIDEKEGNNYSQTLNYSNNDDVRRQIAEDKKIDFAEYLQLMHSASRSYIQNNRSSILAYSYSKTMDQSYSGMSRWNDSESKGENLSVVYRNLDQPHKEIMLAQMRLAINKGSEQKKSVILAFLKNIYAESGTSLQKEIITMVISCLSSNGSYYSNKEIIAFFIDTYKRSSQEMQAWLLDEARSFAGEYSSLGSDEETALYAEMFKAGNDTNKKKIVDIMFKLIGKNYFDYDGIIEFYAQIYDSVPFADKEQIRESVGNMLEGKPHNILKCKSDFYSTAYTTSKITEQRKYWDEMKEVLEGKSDENRAYAIKFFTYIYAGISEDKQGELRGRSAIRKHLMKYLSDDEQRSAIRKEEQRIRPDGKIGYSDKYDMIGMYVSAFKDCSDKIKIEIINKVRSEAEEHESKGLWDGIDDYSEWDFYNRIYDSSSDDIKAVICDSADHLTDYYYNKFYKDKFLRLPDEKRTKVLQKAEAYVLQHADKGWSYALDLLITAYPEVNDAVKQEIEGAILPALKNVTDIPSSDESSFSYRNVCGIFNRVYDKCSEEEKKIIRKKAEELLFKDDVYDYGAYAFFKRIFPGSGDKVKKEIFSYVWPHTDYSSSACEFIASIYPNCDDKTKLKIYQKLSALLAKESDYSNNNPARESYVWTGFYRSCAEDRRSIIIKNLSGYLRQKDAETSPPDFAFSFFNSIYPACSGPEKAEIRAIMKRSALSKFSNESGMALQFFENIYFANDTEGKREIRNIIKNGINNTNEYSAPPFYSSIYPISSDIVKEEIINSVINNAMNGGDFFSYSSGTESAFRFLSSVYDISSEKLKGIMRNFAYKVIISLRANAYDSSLGYAIDFLDGIVGSSSTAERDEIRTKCPPTLCNDYPDPRMKMVGLTVKLYMKSNNNKQKTMFDETVLLLRSENPDDRSFAIAFFDDIYTQITDEEKRLLRSLIEPLLIKNDYDYDPITVKIEAEPSLKNEEVISWFRNAPVPEKVPLTDSLRISSRSFKFFYTAFRGGSIEIKEEILSMALRYLQQKDLVAKYNTLGFLGAIYGTSTSDQQGKIRKNLVPLLNDEEPHVRKILVDFYSYIYFISDGHVREEAKTVLDQKLKDPHYDVNNRTFEFYERIYKMGSEELRSKIRALIMPMLNEENASVRARAVTFIINIYGGSSDSLKYQLREKIKLLINDKDTNVSNTSFSFLKSIYPECEYSLKAEIREKIMPLLINKDQYTRSQAVDFFLGIASSNDEQKEIMRSAFRNMFETLSPAVSQEEIKLIRGLYSNKEIYSYYLKRKMPVFLMISINAGSIKELQGDIQQVAKECLYVMEKDKNVKMRMAIGYNLVQCLDDADSDTKGNILGPLFEYLEGHKGEEVTLFLSSLLTLKYENLPEDYQDRLRTINTKLLPTEPSYEKIFAPGKDKLKIVVCYGMGKRPDEFFDYWKNPRYGLLGKKLKCIESNNIGRNTYTGEIKYGGRKIKVTLEAYVGLSWEKMGEVFTDTMADKDVDMLIYSGHASGLISTAFSMRKGANEMDVEEKLIMINACTSEKYFPGIMAVHPKYQFITTKQISAVDDGAPILMAVLDLFEKKGSWGDLRNMLTQQLDKYPLNVPGNFVLPDEEIYLRDRDSDGDGTADINDRIFDFMPSDIMPKEPNEFGFREQVAMQPDVFPAMTISQYISNNYLFKPFLNGQRDLKLVEADSSPFRNKGWASPRGNDPTFMNINERYPDENSFPILEVSFNAGYAHCSNYWLGVMTIADLNKYLSLRYKIDEKDDHKVVAKQNMSAAMNAAEKKREFRIVAHYLASYYASNPDDRTVIEATWEEVKRKYDLPPVDLKTAILVLQSERHIAETIIEGKATPETLKSVDDFFTKFK